MAERNKLLDKMVYEVMDATALKYEDNFFDIIIDKATIDTLLCDKNPNLKAAMMLKEVQRVLKPNGIYIAISYGKPEDRSFHFERSYLSFDKKEY